MTQGARTARVAEEFREVLAEEIQKLKDPRIGFVTVTGVQVTADLRRAWVSYTVLGDDKQQRSTAAGLRSATPHLRQALGKQVRLRRLPELEFQMDQTLAQHQHIEEIIARLHRDEHLMTEEQALKRAADVLSGAANVALACHVNPDADALGSMLGLSNYLRSRGIGTVCSFADEPFDLPRWASLLPGSEHLVPPSRYPAEPAVMVTCDCASFDRLEVLGRPASKAKELIWIDHHRSNDGRGTVRLVDPDASSTCEMVFRLIETMGGGFDRDVAICLYAGLVTDTGRFQYQATTPETLRIAARLREHDFDHAALVRSMYEDNDPGFLRLLGTALGRMSEAPGASVVWTYLTQADLAEAGVAPGDTDDVIDVLRTARDVDVAAVLKQQRDGRFKVSVRSRGGHDLSAVASAFGGGGHRLAAGYTSEHGPEGTIERLVAALRQAPVTS